PRAALSRDPARAEVGRQVCDLRRRPEQRRAALSRPLGANAGDELSSDRRRNRVSARWRGATTLTPPRLGLPSCARRGRRLRQISASSWGRTLHSFPPTWDEISWKGGSAS